MAAKINSMAKAHRGYRILKRHFPTAHIWVNKHAHSRTIKFTRWTRKAADELRAAGIVFVEGRAPVYHRSADNVRPLDHIRLIVPLEFRGRDVTGVKRGTTTKLVRERKSDRLVQVTMRASTKRWLAHNYPDAIIG